MKFKILFIALFFSLVGFSQEVKWDLNLEGISTTKGIFSYTAVGVNFNKIKVQSGILLGKDYINNETALGWQADVLYFPNGVNTKAFNFLFIASINYFNTKVSLNFSEVTTNFIQGTLGYGFTYFFHKKLALKSTIGLGMLLENRSFNFDTNDPTNKWGFSGIISLGITYKL